MPRHDRLLLAAVLGFLAVQDLTALDGPTVKTPLGSIRGQFKLSQNGRQYEAYEGIPYALPPVGKLRFKAPKKVPAWTGELQATKYGSVCLQLDQQPMDPQEQVIGAEDCLYLNVYVPVRGSSVSRTEEPMPVLFYIHGGGFQFGSGQVAGAKYLMDRDVVFVTVNYRLGPLGFLSTEDETVSGNMGLKDQNMALRWVSENIEWFGGDPKKLTLVGLSAGGASVHYHFLSPLSAGLFQGGISLSGTSFDCWTQAKNSLEKAKKLGSLMGCPTTNLREMVQCLRFRPARTIVQAVKDFQVFYYNPFTPFGPVAEKTTNGAFIDRTPAEIVSSGDVQDLPWVTGVTSEEGLWPVAEFMANEDSMKQLEDNWDEWAPSILFFNYTLPRDQQLEAARRIKRHYFQDKKIDRTTLKELVRLAGDRFFVVDSELAARLQAKVNKQPVWYYYFSYRGADSLSVAMSGIKENYGVSHADDVYYVVNTQFTNPTTTKADLEMQRILIDFWVSFATNGIPKMNDADWLKVDPTQKDFRFLHVQSPGKIFMESKPNLGDTEFWSSLNLQENILPQQSTSTLKEEL